MRYPGHITTKKLLTCWQDVLLFYILCLYIKDSANQPFCYHSMQGTLMHLCDHTAHFSFELYPVWSLRLDASKQTKGKRACWETGFESTLPIHTKALM